jgi:hypothetical protein
MSDQHLSRPQQSPAPIPYDPRDILTGKRSVLPWSRFITVTAAAVQDMMTKAQMKPVASVAIQGATAL